MHSHIEKTVAQKPARKAVKIGGHKKKSTTPLCKMLSRGAAKDARAAAHKAKMAAKAQFRPNMVVGFKPVVNDKIADAISAGTMVRQLRGENAAEAHHNAVRDVARNLPLRRMDYFQVPRATKNNDPSYRNGGSITGDGSRAAARAKPKRVRKSRAKAAAA